MMGSFLCQLRKEFSFVGDAIAWLDQPKYIFFSFHYTSAAAKKKKNLKIFILLEEKSLKLSLNPNLLKISRIPLLTCIGYTFF